MIGYISGKVLENSETGLLVGVGESAGVVGYQLLVPRTASYEALLPGEKIELFVYTHVREDALDLFGFASRMEKELFLTLLSVNGIGPKSALGILTKANPEDLLHAIVDQDKSFLTRVPGIGKKTAERVVLELSDSVAKKVKAGVFGSQARAASAAGGGFGSLALRPKPKGEDLAIFEDAKAALLGLGIRENDAEDLLKRALSDVDVAKIRAEDLVKTALKELGHGIR